MALGAITATLVGVAKIDTAAFKTLLDAVNTGAATQGADITSIHIVPYGNCQAAVWKCARAAA
jgi:hypothetical protein